ncbi:MAG: TonB-dependent receptor [bacterium]
MRCRRSIKYPHFGGFQPHVVLGCVFVLAVSALLGAARRATAAPSRAQPQPQPQPKSQPQSQPRHRPRVRYPKLLKFVPAPYPEKARRSGLEGVVRMHVTVDSSGAVAGVVVVQSVSPELDAAAVGAVRQFRYRPASVDGKPVSVKITVAYPFRLRPLERPAGRRPATARRVASRPTDRPAAARVSPLAELRGVVRQKGTRQRLEDAEVVVRLLRPGEKGLGRAVARATTGSQGRFSLALAPGRYRVEVRVSGCFLFRVTERLAPGTRLAVEYFVERRVYDPYQTVVTVRALRREVTRYSVPLPVIEKIPGTQGDALRAIQNMPGVGRAAFSLGFLIIRGSAPRDTKVLFEGHRIPMLYHFMGLSSVFNSDLLRQIDFIPGNFSVRYGRATGGIIDVFARQGKRDGWHGYLDVDLWDVGALVEGPVGKGSIALSLRRAHIDAILALIPDIALTAAYYDYQAMLDYPVLRGQLKVVAFGADDRLKRRIEQTSSFEQVHVTLFVKTIVLWKRRWGDHELRLSVAGGYTRTESGPGPDHVEDTGRGAWRLHYAYDASPRLNIAFGLVGEVARARLSTGPSALSLSLLENEDVPPDGSGAQEILSTLVSQAAYVEATWKPVPRLTLIPGLRVDYFRGGAVNRAVFDPRFTAQVELIPKRLRMTAAVGLFHQEPEVEQIHRLTGGNPTLRHERALHAGLGLDWKILDSLSLELNGFYKQLWGVVTESDSQVFRDGRLEPENLSNHGRGRIYGAELLLKKVSNYDCPRFLKLEKCFGWLSYTILRSERQQRPGDPWEIFEEDQTHLFTFVVSGTWPGGWELGIRFRIASGMPERFYSGGIFDSDANAYLPARGTAYQGRMPLFHQLDIRVDKRFTFKKWMLSIYLDIQNVYSYQHSEFVQYNYNYTQNGMLKGLPIVPSLGIKGEF